MGEKEERVIKGFNVVLVEPEIPNNTGNIGRLCVATESILHLVHPLGFKIDDSRVRRAGLDYWPDLDLKEYGSIDELRQSMNRSGAVHLMSSHGIQSVYKRSIKRGDWLVFGRESIGLPKELKDMFPYDIVKIPFTGKVRSFNLSNAVAMVLGEGMRQSGL